MASATSDGRTGGAGRYVPSTVRHSVKILVAGAFGVGKTTLVGSVSEITPLRTEEAMTAASVGVDDLAGLPGKTTTTVAMDFGRITMPPEVVLYLFGVPGQQRFWDLWAGLADGAAGALVLVDTRRLADSFPVLDVLEQQANMPLAVAVNRFPDAASYTADQVREALDVPPHVPVVDCDARDRASCARALITLVQHTLALNTERAPS